MIPAIETPARSPDRVRRLHRLRINRPGRGQLGAATPHPQPPAQPVDQPWGRPRALQRSKKAYTASQGGKSTGNARHSMHPGTRQLAVVASLG
ncbi:MAG: hypothetical protein ACRDRX_08300 [Pseudonocardiaceae bacterium]